MENKLAWFFPVFLAVVLPHSLEGQTRIHIALSKSSPNYTGWLEKASPDLAFHDLQGMFPAEALKVLSTCHGLLLTGGVDINPDLYGRATDSAKCTGRDAKRDELELALIEKARMLGMPILGICRGHQLLAVEGGGTLYADIPLDFPSPTSHGSNGPDDSFHPMRVNPGSLLADICQCREGVVSSSHHQAVRTLPPHFTGNAVSEEGLIEGLELSDRQHSEFFLGVQWHPERMDFAQPLSGPVALRFVQACSAFLNHEKFDPETPGQANPGIKK